MITPKLKQLIKQSAEVIALYQSVNEDATIEISPYANKDEKDSEIVYITFKKVTEFNWQFLEPLAEHLIRTNIGWSILILDDELVINLYY